MIGFISSILCLIMILNTGGKKIDEDFYSFLIKFSYDEEFQIERINFPLTKTELSDDLDKRVTKEVEVKEWKHISLIPKGQSYFTDIQHSFKHENSTSNEKIFLFVGIENGIDIRYYFKRYNGLWYLIELKDLST